MKKKPDEKDKDPIEVVSKKKTVAERKQDATDKEKGMTAADKRAREDVKTANAALIKMSDELVKWLPTLSGYQKDSGDTNEELLFAIKELRTLNMRAGKLKKGTASAKEIEWLGNALESTSKQTAHVASNTGNLKDKEMFNLRLKQEKLSAKKLTESFDTSFKLMQTKLGMQLGEFVKINSESMAAFSQQAKGDLLRSSLTMFLGPAAPAVKLLDSMLGFDTLFAKKEKEKDDKETQDKNAKTGLLSSTKNILKSGLLFVGKRVDKSSEKAANRESRLSKLMGNLGLIAGKGTRAVLNALTGTTSAIEKSSEANSEKHQSEEKDHKLEANRERAFRKKMLRALGMLKGKDSGIFGMIGSLLSSVGSLFMEGLKFLGSGISNAFKLALSGLGLLGLGPIIKSVGSVVTKALRLLGIGAEAGEAAAVATEIATAGEAATAAAGVATMTAATAAAMVGGAVAVGAGSLMMGKELKEGWQGKTSGRGAWDKNTSPELVNQIKDAATKGDVDPTFLRTLTFRESGGDANANRYNNKDAKGLNQFVGSTAERFGMVGDAVYDPVKSLEATVEYTKENAKALVAAGFNATPQNLYLAHQQGADGAIMLLKAASSGAAIPASLTRVKKSGFSAITGNLPPSLKQAGVYAPTAAEFVSGWNQQYNSDEMNSRQMPGHTRIAAKGSSSTLSGYASHAPLTTTSSSTQAAPPTEAKRTDLQQPIEVIVEQPEQKEQRGGRSVSMGNPVTLSSIPMGFDGNTGLVLMNIGAMG